MNIGNDQPFFLIAGPCQIESKEHALKMATEIKKVSDHMGPMWSETCLLYTSDAADE